eukprot:13302150-Alexandrium_andersonii.AAC.1
MCVWRPLTGWWPRHHQQVQCLREMHACRAVVIFVALLGRPCGFAVTRHCQLFLSSRCQSRAFHPFAVPGLP